jgi:hypothetical protein
MVVALSSWAWARLKLAALSCPKLAVIVVRNTPRSTRSAASLRRRCCSIISGVAKVERVNINSGWMLTHFGHSAAVSKALRESRPSMRPRRPCGEMVSAIWAALRWVPVSASTMSTLAKPAACSCGANGWLWSITCWAPRLLAQSWVCGREAVAMTVRAVSLRASWMAMEPTPPAPPTTSSER